MIDLLVSADSGISQRWYNEDYYEIWMWFSDLPEGFEFDLHMDGFLFSLVGCDKRKKSP